MGINCQLERIHTDAAITASAQHGSPVTPIKPVSVETVMMVKLYAMMNSLLLLSWIATVLLMMKPVGLLLLDLAFTTV